MLVTVIKAKSCSIIWSPHLGLSPLPPVLMAEPVVVPGQVCFGKVSLALAAAEHPPLAVPSVLVEMLRVFLRGLLVLLMVCSQQGQQDREGWGRGQRDRSWF